MPKSTDFEKLVAKIVEELEPTAVVKWNDHILGRKSGLNRQIDVSIRRTDPDTLGVIDAKDHGRPADVGKIDALASVMRDVGANYGALVCSGGFAKSIRQYARNSGISLFNVHDAASVNWSLELKVPIIWTELTPHVWLSGALHAEAGDSFVDDDPHGMQVTLDGGLTKIDPVDTFARLWAEGSINRGVGQVHRLAPEGPVQAFVLDHADQKQ